jgi:CheY-like chemotaxis protein
MKPEPILLVDDDPACPTAVRLALGDDYEVLVQTTRFDALNFLKGDASSIRGVIVDLNLTDKTDNFGRDILERLAELDIPCVVFSSSISDVDSERAAQAARFKNEFGVLDTIGKGDARDAMSSLRELRECVRKMCVIYLDRYRSRAIGSVEAVLERRLQAARDRHQAQLRGIQGTPRLAGGQARSKLSLEADRDLKDAKSEAKKLLAAAQAEIAAAGSVEDVEAARARVLRTIGEA